MAEAPLKPKSKVKKKKQEKKVFVNKPEEASDEQICDSLCDEVKDDVTVEEERKVTEKIVTVSSCDSEKNEIELDVIKDKSDIEKTETVKEISSIKTINSINVQTPSAPTAEHCPIAENDAYYSAFHELQREIRELNKQTIVHKQPSDVNLYPQLPPEYSLSQKNVNLYPQLPPEYSVLEKSSLSANKHLENKSIHSRNMYPELSKTEYMQYGEMRPKEDVQCLPSESFLSIIKSGKKEYNINREEIRAYTIEQLMNFYDISKILKKNDMFINSFIKNEENVEDKDLFKLILKYQNARQNKKLSKEKLESLRDKFFEDKENVWNIKATSEKFEERCEDKKWVTYLYSYKVAELNEQMHKNVCKNLNDIRNEIKSEFWCHLFAVDYFKLQIENFLFELSSLSTFKDISTQKPVTGYNKRDFSELKNIECLKRSISVLFCFQRRRTDDDEFLKEIQGWLTNLIALLLRIATLEDHLFILNHVLRCPPGVGEWATNFIQFPGSCLWLASKHSYMDSPLLDHIITVFATLLFPIRAREKFLECYKSSVMLATGGETPHDKWVMVTSIEGEDTVEEMDVCDILLRWKESDILGLFQQIPFGDMFKFLLEIKVEDNKEFCKIDNFEEKKMVKLLSIVTWLIYIFREGFNTFQCRKYCDFSKLLGQYISDSVKYICYHWKNFRSSHESVDEAMTKRLQVEFDQFIYRSVASILTSKRKEAWQYLVLPYELVSPETMWHIAWLMVNWHSTESNKLSDSDIITKLQDLKYREMFQEQLCHLKINEITYLVNGLMTMIVSRKQDEKLYVCILTIVVFELFIFELCNGSCTVVLKPVKKLLILALLTS
ncbi:ectopic P granules protein 5 homolog [Centruroides sculpturatus]|uniref:ectopic P granules protein 5 homolog n=1 Tax=Centruroides sculpturatus TaxID=218467 RepID=UPI000C6D00D5|nr:ectopic P granules protein 5 homolog [Centruroides sculpturatus]